MSRGVCGNTGPHAFWQTQLRVCGTLAEPAFETTVVQGPKTGIPCELYPSDHVALISKLDWAIADGVARD